MVITRRIKELYAGLVLLALPFCPAFAGEKVDVFSQPIPSDEPVPQQGMPALPHTVDVFSAQRGSSGRAPAGASEQNRALRERSAEKMRQIEEERAQKRARSQEMRQRADEKREQLLQARSDFVSTSGGSKPLPAAGETGKGDTGKIEEIQPKITQKRGQELTVPDSNEGKSMSRRSGGSRLQQAVNRVGNRAASRANSLGNRAASRANSLSNRAVNRALTPIRRAINAPIRF